MGASCLPRWQICCAGGRASIISPARWAIGQAASYGWRDLLELLALITINLGVFNLLPFPALDGGKVVFLAIEGITGHAVPEKLQGTLTIAAFALLFGLMIFATYNDIIRIVTGAV